MASVACAQGEIHPHLYLQILIQVKSLSSSISLRFLTKDLSSFDFVCVYERLNVCYIYLFLSSVFV